jgi:hypothetical protein
MWKTKRTNGVTIVRFLNEGHEIAITTGVDARTASPNSQLDAGVPAGEHG